MIAVHARAAGLLAVLALANVIACRRNPESEAIAAAVRNGPGTQVHVAEYSTFPWDRVCALGPYTSSEDLDSITGIRGAAAQAHDIQSNDGINVLMFIDDDRIVSSVALPRSDADFGPDLVGKCYSRKQAVFVVRVPPQNSWGNIGLNAEGEP